MHIYLLTVRYTISYTHFVEAQRRIGVLEAGFSMSISCCICLICSHWLSRLEGENDRVFARWAYSVMFWAGASAFAISANIHGLSLADAATSVASLVGFPSFSFTNIAPDMMLSLTSCGISAMHFAATWSVYPQWKHTPSWPCEFPQLISVPFDADFLIPPCFCYFPAKYSHSLLVSLLPLLLLGKQLVITMWASCFLGEAMISLVSALLYAWWVLIVQEWRIHGGGGEPCQWFLSHEGMFYSSKLIGDGLNSVDKLSNWFWWVMSDIVEVAVQIEMVWHNVLFKFFLQQGPGF